MMTAGEVSLLVGLLANAGVILWVAKINNKKMNSVLGDIHKVEKATNSMKDRLVAATRKGALAEGKKFEKDKQSRKNKSSASNPRSCTTHKRK